MGSYFFWRINSFSRGYFLFFCLQAVNFAKDGTYAVTVKGELNMHGVTKPVEANGSIKVSGKIINASSEFSVNLDDYGINGGAIAAGKVSKEPTISVTAEF